jgi:cyanate lyase
LLEQPPLPTDAAKLIAERLDLDDNAATLLQTIPKPACIPGSLPTDPTIYRFHEIVQVHGTTLRTLVHEQFGGGHHQRNQLQDRYQESSRPRGVVHAQSHLRRQLSAV